MIIGSILNAEASDVVTIAPDASVSDTLVLIRTKQIEAVIVTNASGMAGLLTRGDIVGFIPEHGATINSTRVRAIMKRDVITVSREESAMHVMTQMTRYQITHIPVVDRTRLIGNVSIDDLVKERLGNLDINAAASLEL